VSKVKKYAVIYHDSYYGDVYYGACFPTEQAAKEYIAKATKKPTISWYVFEKRYGLVSETKTNIEFKFWQPQAEEPAAPPKEKKARKKRAAKDPAPALPEVPEGASAGDHAGQDPDVQEVPAADVPF
jgi:hypothetical protein